MKFFNQLMLYVGVVCLSVALGTLHGQATGLFTFGCGVLFISAGWLGIRYLDGK